MSNIHHPEGLFLNWGTSLGYDPRTERRGLAKPSGSEKTFLHPSSSIVKENGGFFIKQERWQVHVLKERRVYFDADIYMWLYFEYLRVSWNTFTHEAMKIFEWNMEEFEWDVEKFERERIKNIEKLIERTRRRSEEAQK